MKLKNILAFILSLSLFVGVAAGTSLQSSSENEPENSEGVFICEDTGEEGPMFYAADYSADITNEPHYHTQKNDTFDSMNFHNAPRTYRGDSVKVAVIDSGLNYTHEDFSLDGNQVIQKHSRTIDNTSGSWLYYQFDNDGDTSIGSFPAKINDTFGHGTNVASVIASQINAAGCAGIAPNVELYIYKVTNTKNGYEWTAIINALQYCIDEGIDVINMSFQSYEHAVSYGSDSMDASAGCSSVLTNSLNACHNAGITLVAAAGNYNTSEPSYPASNNHVISVGSLAKSSTTTKAGYSNLSGIDLVAPGTVYVATQGNNIAYKETAGTSFSAPIVTAAIALYKQAHPSATPAQIEQALYDSCDSINGSYPSWAGNGRLNIDKFLDVDGWPSEIVVNNPEVDNDQLSIRKGQTFDLDVSVNGSGSFNEGVVFENLDTDILTVDSNGRITAIEEGEDLVSIASVLDSDVTITLYVTVLPPATLELSPSTLKMDTGSVYQLSATTNPSATITYSSNNTSVATVGATGLVSAKAHGTAVITASANGLSRTCTVTVNDVAATGVTLSQSSATIIVGNYITLTADVLPINATNKNVTWSTGNATVASVTTNGKVTGLKAGTTYINAVTHNGFSATCSVTVQNRAVTGITLSKTATTIFVGNSEIITAVVTPSNATIKDINWSSSNTAVATVSSGTITAVSVGSATITAQSVSDPSVTATCAVTVQAQPSYTKVTSISQLMTGDKVIVRTDESTPRGVTGWNNNKDATISTTESDWVQFSVTVANDYYTLYDEGAKKFIASPGGNEFKYGTTGGQCVANDNGYLQCNSRYFVINGSYYRFYGSVGSYEPFCVYKINKNVSSISIDSAPTKTVYDEGDCFDPSGLSLTVTYTDSTSGTVTYASYASSFSFSPSLDAELTTSNTSVTIGYGGKTVTQSITVNALKVVDYLSLSGQTTSFHEGDAFSFGGTVTAYYTDGTQGNVTSSSTFTGYNMTTIGEHTVTVSFANKSGTTEETYNINVLAGVLTGISLSGQTTSYDKNAPFSFDGTCTATFENGYQKVVIPTSVSNVKTATSGVKEVTVSYTYNGVTQSTSYNITVASNRVVIETSTTTGYVLLGTITYPSNVETITPNSGLTVSKSGSTTIENSYIRCGSGSKSGTVTVNSSSANITKVVARMRSYSNDGTINISFCGSTLQINGTETDYTKEYTSAVSSFSISNNSTSGKRVNIYSISVYTTGQIEVETDISNSEDCLGLETFIDTYLHFADYNESLGYCKDSEHHYYSTAKTAFNALNLHQRTLFTSNSAYTNEWARLSTWASFNGDTLNGNTTLAAGQRINPVSIINEYTTAIIVVVVVSIIALASIGGYFYLSKRKEHI